MVFNGDDIYILKEMEATHAEIEWKLLLEKLISRR